VRVTFFDTLLTSLRATFGWLCPLTKTIAAATQPIPIIGITEIYP